MKHCYFRSFDVGAGDCNVIRLVDGDEQYAIMVDCGPMTAAVKENVETVLHKQMIELASLEDGADNSDILDMLEEIDEEKE